jgi:hypothetical protein
MLRVEMLPAGNGDSLWVEYGSASEIHRVLIDAGHASTYPHLRERILALPAAERVFELLIVTHIDNDHIEGLLPLLQDTALQCQFKDVWYNGWRHLGLPPAADTPEDALGPKQGEFLGVLIEDKGLPWNAAFGHGPVLVPTTGDLQRRELDGGLSLTLLSPTPNQLAALIPTWRQVIQDAHFQPGDTAAMRTQLQRRKYNAALDDVLGSEDIYTSDDVDGGGDLDPDEIDIDDTLGRVEDGPGGSDTSEPNGTSIAVLAEYGGKTALLTGDAFAGVLAASLIRANASAKRPLSVDMWKLAHHGSWANFTPELFALVRTSRFLVSTNGSGYHHPHARTLNYIIDHYAGRGRPNLVFNYRTATTEAWAQFHPAAGKFTASYPVGAVVVI